MKEIEQKTYELIQLIKESPYYQNYKKSFAKVSKQPELKQRLDQFRARTFFMYNVMDDTDLFEETDRIEFEHKELRSIPEVNEFLDAEIALCRILKETEARISMAIDVQVPEV